MSVTRWILMFSAIVILGVAPEGSVVIAWSAIGRWLRRSK